MGLVDFTANMFERHDMPDALTRLGVSFLVGRTSRKLSGLDSSANRTFAHGMAEYPIAVDTAAANQQHYEVPAAFFDLVLGPQRKYSCCLYPSGDTSLAQAEEFALGQTARNAGLADGQNILELGCGWGSLSLWMASQFPKAKITAVSNSRSQRHAIEARAVDRGLTNLNVITADMNDFRSDGTFDRIVSVEMFEHMSNWHPLLDRIRGWLKPGGRLFIHIFTHRKAPYRFESGDKADWIAQHFFTGGIMPSHDLMRAFADVFEVEKEWRWNGEHYQRTAEDWLSNFDANRTKIELVFGEVYGEDTPIWMRRWRMFFLATAGLFGHRGGEEWAVSHYLMKRATS